MSFNEAFSDMLYSRMEERDFYDQLKENGAYMEWLSKYEAARSLAGDSGQIRDLIQAMNRLFDLQAQYIYRMGMQDMLTMTRRDFLTEDLL